MDAELIKTVQDLIGFVKDVSPDVWKILIWQQYVGAFCWLSIFIFSGVITYFGFRIFQKGDEDWSGPVGVVVMGAFGFIFFVAFIGLFTDCVPKLLNPEYYALMALKP